jgi:hypothetical protein
MIATRQTLTGTRAGHKHVGSCPKNNPPSDKGFFACKARPLNSTGWPQTLSLAGTAHMCHCYSLGNPTWQCNEPMPGTATHGRTTQRMYTSTHRQADTKGSSKSAESRTNHEGAQQQGRCRHARSSSKTHSVCTPILGTAKQLRQALLPKNSAYQGRTSCKHHVQVLMHCITCTQCAVARTATQLQRTRKLR